MKGVVHHCSADLHTCAGTSQRHEPMHSMVKNHALFDVPESGTWTCQGYGLAWYNLTPCSEVIRQEGRGVQLSISDGLKITC